MLLDVEGEMLGDLVLVDDLADAHPDLVAAAKTSPLDHPLDLLELLLGSLEQGLALVTAQLR